MSKLEEYVLVIGCFQGGLLFLLLTFDRRMSTASRVLGLLCLLMACQLAMPFLRSAECGTLQLLVGLIFYFPAAGGSLAYLYCRSALTERPLGWGDLLLFTPWAFCYVLAGDFIVSNPQALLRWINGAHAQTWRLQLSEYVLFTQAFGFAGLTARMIWQYGARASQTLANYNPDVFRWLMTLQAFTVIIWFSHALPALTSAPVAFSELANLLMVVLIYLVAITQWRDPHFLYIPQLAEEQASDAAALAGHEVTQSDDDGLRAQLFEEIQGIVERDQLFLDSQLTLSSLAAATGFSRHQVSEALNGHAGKNFYEFINAYRVAAVQRRLSEGDRRKLLDIAMDCGFSSKSTFNAIFKQSVGLTPTAYRKTLAVKRI
jgi:AraC-like DNA-binding protein